VTNLCFMTKHHNMVGVRMGNRNQYVIFI
jgi:hypothetical protein